MRFQQYLKEANIRFNKPENLSEKEWRELYKVWNTLHKKCKPFMKEFEKLVKRHNYKQTEAMYLFRGMRDRGMWSINKIRKDRLPKDSPMEFHELVDNAFEENFGVKVRSEGLFATSEFNEAKHYGKVYTVFPVGKYRLIWSDSVEDLYSKFEDDIRNGYIGDEPPDSVYESWEDEWEREYGEGSNGEFVAHQYDNISSPYLSDAIEMLIDHLRGEIDRDDYENEDDYIEALDEVTELVGEDDFEWFPEVSKDVYIEQQEMEWQENAITQSHMNEFVDRYYKEGKLSEYFRDSVSGPSVEVHIIANEYIAVRADYTLWISEMLDADYQPNLPFDEFKNFDDE